MVYQTYLKMIIDLRIQQTTENYEQAMGSGALNTEDTAWCQEFACKDLFRERLQLRYIGANVKHQGIHNGNTIRIKQANQLLAV